MKVCVVGLGEIGSEVFDELQKGNHEIWGVDKDPKALEGKVKYNTFTLTNLVKADIYIICVYTTEQVMNVVREIKEIAEDPLIIVEATVEQGTHRRIVGEMGENKFGLVMFPHRFNPGDEEHKVFNLDRVAGAIDDDSYDRFLQFIGGYHRTLIFRTSIEIAEICKPVENAIRYIEIALAEDLKIACEEKGISFRELRDAINTKWNIDVKEVRDGVGGKCLPKDALIALKMLKSEMLKTAISVDKKYREGLK